MTLISPLSCWFHVAALPGALLCLFKLCLLCHPLSSRHPSARLYVPCIIINCHACTASTRALSAARTAIINMAFTHKFAPTTSHAASRRRSRTQGDLIPTSEEINILLLETPRKVAFTPLDAEQEDSDDDVPTPDAALRPETPFRSSMVLPPLGSLMHSVHSAAKASELAHFNGTLTPEFSQARPCAAALKISSVYCIPSLVMSSCALRAVILYVDASILPTSRASGPTTDARNGTQDLV